MLPKYHSHHINIELKTQCRIFYLKKTFKLNYTRRALYKVDMVDVGNRKCSRRMNSSEVFRVINDVEILGQ